MTDRAASAGARSFPESSESNRSGGNRWKTDYLPIRPSLPRPLLPIRIMAALALLLGVCRPILAAPGDVDPGFAAGVGPDQRVLSLGLQSDKKVICGGDFLNVGAVARARIARLNTDGTLDASFDPGTGANSSVYKVLVQPDNKILIAGSFSVVRNDTHPRLARFNPDGSMDPGFDVGTGPNSDVYAMVLLANGDLIIGGAFSVVAGQPRNHLARIKANGSLDPTFSLSLNANVYALAVTADGKVLMGGDFTTVSGISRIRVMRLNPDGTMDQTFDPALGPNSSVRILVPQADGKVLMGGSFGDVNGAGHPYLCRLNSDGLPDLSYSPGMNNGVYAMALQSDGRLLAGGDFTTVSTLVGTTLVPVTANRVVRLLADGTPDQTFNVGTGPETTVNTMTLQTDGNLLVGGTFTQFNGPNHPHVVRLLSASTAVGGEFEFSAARYAVSESQATATIEVHRNGPTTAAVTVDYATANGTALATDYTAATGTLNFAVGETKKTFAVTLLPDTGLEDDESVVLALSNPTGGATLGAQRSALLVILNDDTTTAMGGVDTGFANGASGSVYASFSGVQSDGKALLVGEFFSLAGQSRLRIGRLNADGTPDSTFKSAAWLNGAAYAVTVQADGRVLVGGAFTLANGVTRNRLVRFNSNGTVDTTFNPGIGPNSTVVSLLALPDGRILVGGSFTAYNNDTHTYLVRLFSDGNVDPDFNPQVNNTVWTLARTADGKVWAGGDFTSVLGVPRNRLVRFQADGTLDTTFDPAAGPNSTVRALVVQSDGKAVIGGSFSDVNGSGRGYVCRLSANGLPDLSFAATANNAVYAVALQSNGRWVIGGEFSSISGVPYVRLARLLADGTPDPSFDVGTGANAAVSNLAIQPDGHILVGGDFTLYNGLNHPHLVRVQGQSAAGGGEFEFSAANYAVSESQATATIEVHRTGPTTAAVTVDYTAANGTATAGDYSFVPGTLSFGIGETKKTFTVQIVADALTEDDETVNLTLSNPTGGAALGGQRAAVLTILNDDVSNAVGAADNAFATVGLGGVFGTAVQADGKVMVVGDYSGFPDGARLRVARLNNTGALDATFNPAAWLNAAATTVVVQSDGRALVGGTFTVANGVTRNRIVRYNADGTVDPSFNPGIGPNTTVNSLLVLPDGRILVAGSFTAFNNDTHPYLVRLFSDGNLDPGFNPQINGTVWTLFRGADGKLLVAGEFTSVLGEARNRIARFNPDGSLDETFDPGAGPNSTVRALVMQSDGKILIGGPFSDVGGTGHPYVCRLNANGLPDADYTAVPNNAVYAMALQPNGRLVVGGDFSAISGVTLGRLARLLGDGTPDPSFLVGTGANDTVLTLNLQADGSIIAGGNFTLINGLKHPHLARLRGTSTAAGGEMEFSAATYDVSESQSVATIEVRRTGPATTAVTVGYSTSDGTATAADYVPVAGFLAFAAGETKKTFDVPLVSDTAVEDDKTVILTLSNPTGGAALGGQRAAVLFIVNDDNSSNIGGVDATFTPALSGPVYATALQSDGKILVVGDFAGFSDGSRLRVARINGDGTLDDSFDPEAWLNGYADAVVVQADGRILVGGTFTVVSGITRNRLVRFNTDGSVDPTFNPGIGPNSTVYSLLVQTDGSILVGGAFSAVGNDPFAYLVRLTSDGLLDPSYNPQVNAPVWTLAQAGGGKVVIGGEFTSVLTSNRIRVARLNADGSLDAGFDPGVGPNSTVRALVIQPDEKVIIGGQFSDVNGSGRVGLCRLTPAGVPEPGHSGTAGGPVYAMALLPDGRLLAGGDFTATASQPANRLMILLDNGKPDLSFNVGLGANSTVFAVTLQPGGNIIAGGAFTKFDGLTHLHLVRVRGSTTPVAVRYKFTSITTTPGGIQMEGTAGAGQSYMLEYSLDLVTWVGVTTKTATGATLPFTDANPPDDHRAYRVRNL